MEDSKLIVCGKWHAEYDEFGKLTTFENNGSLYESFGYEAEDCNSAKTSWLASIHPDDKERVKQHIIECEKKNPDGPDFDVEYRIMTKNGYHLVHDHAIITRRDDGTVIRADGVVFDIESVVKDNEYHKLISRNYSRLLALEDNLEVLYDVDLKTSKYEILVKSKTYEEIYKNLTDNSSFWTDLENNLTVVHPDDRQLIVDSMKAGSMHKSLADNEHFDIFCRVMLNGKYTWYRIRTVYKNRDKEGVIVGIFNAENDVEAKQIADQKKELERKQEELKESLSFTNFFLDTYVSAYYVNLDDFTYKTYKKAENLYGSNNEANDFFVDLNSYINHRVHPDDRTELCDVLNVDYLRNVLEKTPEYSHFYRDISGGDEKIYKVQVIRGANESYAALGFVDLTRGFLEQQGRLLGAIPLSTDVLTKANIGMWAFELDEGKAPRMYADEAMLGLIGLDHRISPEDTYHAWYDNIDDDSYDLVSDAVDKMILGEHAEVQYPWHHPNGETWIVRCGGVRNFEYKNGIRIEGTHQNVTELIHYDEKERKREEHQRKVEIARIKAEASDKAKTEFLFNMSHDIRTPMNAILGYTDIALNHIDEPDRVNDSLNKIKDSGGHLLKLINDILEMSRIEAGKMEIVMGPLNIYEAVESVANMSKTLASTKSISFKVKVDEIKNPYIYADELHTNQIIINIISNAIKYTGSGGAVEYHIEQISKVENGKAVYRFTVKDTGFGMSEDFQKHLFESFSREQTSTVSGEEGTGLGLAIVKRIVDLIGGTISVQSSLGEGSTFVVELPFEVMTDSDVEAFKASLKKEHVIADSNTLKGRKVLLVEDNELNREIAEEILEEAELDIETAEDGAIAVKMVSEKGIHYYDFILMDIQMPVMDGYEATAEIRKLPDGGKVPVIALSANAFKEDVERSLAAGMNAHVAKPIEISELFDTMISLL